MASALRCLARTVLIKRSVERVFAPSTAIAQIQVRHSIGKDKTSPLISTLNPSELPDFEVSKDPKEWEYVERLLPIAIVPQPNKVNGPTPSGWVPPRDEGKTHPYFVPRNRNHMQPVYMMLSYRDTRKITIIRRIQGDIWQMEKDLRKFLESKIKTKYKHLASHVNEMSGQIRFRGDYVAYVKQWMDMKGF